MRIILMALALGSLTACGSGGGGDGAAPSAPQPPVSQPPATLPPVEFTAYGTLTATEKELLGVDSNANGVRDTVEAVIMKTYTDPVQQGNILKYAQWMTWATLRGQRGTTSTPGELTDFGNAVACAYRTRYAVLGEKGADENELRSELLDNFARTRAFLTWDASTSEMPSTSAMEPCAATQKVGAV